MTPNNFRIKNGLTVSNGASITGSLAAGNTTITGFANVSVSVNSALFTVGTTVVANATGTYATQLNGKTEGNLNVNSSSTALTSNNTSFLGGTAAASYALLSGAAFTGAVSGITTLAAGNTTITGFANVSTSVNSALLTVGTSFIANTTGAYHTGTINAASHTVSTSFIANSLGVYHTGTVNAASHTTTGITINATAIVPTSNSSGQTLGNSISRFVISANTIDATGAITGTTANLSTSVNSALLTVGTSFIANTTGAYHTGTVNAASHTVGTSFIANTTALYSAANLQISTINATSWGATLTSNATTALLTIGNSSISSTINGSNFTGTANNSSFLGGTAAASYALLSGAAFTGAVSGITTLAAGNTSITGFANVSTTLQVGTNTATFGTAVYIIASGNTGVGTSSPASLFHVKRGSNATENYPTNTWAARVINATDASTENGLVVGNRWAAAESTVFEAGSIYGGGSAWASYYKVTGIGTHVWGTGSTGTEKMRIDVNGNTGIGNTAPADKLSVNGTTFLGSTLAAGNTSITGFANVSTSVNSAALSVGTSFVANTTQVTIAAGVSLSANGGVGTAAQVLTSNGATGSPYWSTVSSGTTYTFSTGLINTSGTITVNSSYIATISANNSSYLGGTAAASYALLSGATFTGAVVPASNSSGQTLGNSISRFVITANSVTASGDVTAFSDITLKDDIVTINYALDKVKSIRGVSYVRNDYNDGLTRLGVIAQEIEKILPEVVTENSDGIKAVNYSAIIPVLIEAIKEQQNQIDELKRMIYDSGK